jgi:N-acetylmuramoyl-L-alanine amidase
MEEVTLNIIERPSPNFGNRPQGMKPDLIVLHGTAGRTDEGDLGWLCQRGSGVSYHYMVGRDGKVYRLVQDEKRAWHAGLSVYDDKPNVNNYSIGVALSNNGSGKEQYPVQQCIAAGILLALICKEWGIPSHRIVGHNHISGAHTGVRPDPKTDPWDWFPWARILGVTAATLEDMRRRP